MWAVHGGRCHIPPAVGPPQHLRGQNDTADRKGNDRCWRTTDTLWSYMRMAGPEDGGVSRAAGHGHAMREVACVQVLHADCLG
eukprot:scaffold139991_cov35-Tisochrysis_lutea.AAC.2